ncbi:hypothetical protein [Bdellovibrio sp. HCB337]|uniref:hypothetical protein n=1 Tax=Bdellovibrio sp. HCB337 TaxID=3394358 RepID=UPI0039A4B769
MKLFSTLLIASLFVISCTNSSSTPTPSPASGNSDDTIRKIPPTPEELSETFKSFYAEWTASCNTITWKEEDPETFLLAKDFLLGTILKNTPYVEGAENILLIRADFKSRTGEQSAQDFLPLAQKLLKKN